MNRFVSYLLFLLISSSRAEFWSPLSRDSTAALFPSSSRSRRLSRSDYAPTGQVPFVELDALNLRDLNIPTFELSFGNEDGVKVFEGINYDKETWYGVEKDAGAILYLVVTPGSKHLTGMLHDVNKSYGIWTRADGSVFATLEEENSFNANEGRRLQKRKARPLKGSKPPQVPAKQRALKKTSKSKKTRVDIMILYTQHAMCGHASQDSDCEPNRENREAIEAEAKLNVAITNVAFIQSGVNVDLQLVHVGPDPQVNFYPTELDPTNHDDDAVYREILEQNSAISLIPDRDDISRLRDKHGADIVAYMISNDYGDIFGGNGKAGDVFVQLSSTLPAPPVDGAAGAYIVFNRNGRFHFLFSHEIGHIFGVDHGNAFCNANTNAVDPFVGPCFKTIMQSRTSSTQCACIDTDDGSTAAVTGIVPRIPLYSSPNLAYSGHILTPSSGFDSVSIINANAPFVADFRDRPSKAIPLIFGTVIAAACVAGTLVAKKRKCITTCYPRVCDLDSDIVAVDNDGSQKYVRDLGIAHCQSSLHDENSTSGVVDGSKTEKVQYDDAISADGSTASSTFLERMICKPPSCR